MKDSGKITIFLIFLFLSTIFLGVILPLRFQFIEYCSELTKEEKEIAKIAVRDVETELGVFLIRRYCIENITKLDGEWEVKLIQYSFFNLPTVRAKVVIVEKPDNNYRVQSGSFREASPYAVIIMLLLPTIFIKRFFIFIPFIVLAYLIKKSRLKNLLKGQKQTK